MTARPSPSSRAPGLALACAVHAAAFAAAAWMGPSEPSSWFALSLLPLIGLHMTVGALALSGRTRARQHVWVALAGYSLLWLAALSWVIVTSATYLAEIYGGMGQAVAAALAVIWGVIVLFTLPLSLWCLSLHRPRWLLRAPTAIGAGLALAAAALMTCCVGRAATLRPAGTAGRARLERTLSAIAREHPGTPAGRAPRSILQRAPLVCARPIASAGLTVLASTLDLTGRPLSSCLQTPDPNELEGALRSLLRQSARNAPIKLDWVRAIQALPRIHPLLDALAVRPALDGLCAAGKCLAPWQLVTFDAFTANRPMDSMRDASFGVSLDALTRALGAPDGAPLERIETVSWLIDRGALLPLARGRPMQATVDDAALDRAVALAGQHIVAAERPDGTFRYLLDPFDGRTNERMVSMRRQAGTVFALCELLPATQVAEPATRALGLLRGYERRHGELAMLTDKDDVAEIGPSALPLIAFSACRAAVGDRHDDLIGGMTRFLLRLQRPNGAFYPELDLASGEPRGERESLYAGGQAMLGLVLAEQIARASPGPHWADAKALADGIERGMRYYANDYWPRALRSLFYLEENWHCLAARAALRSHRNDDYERFCLDYAHFKQRWILTDRPGTSPEHIGGYSMSDIFPPHAAVTAGFGEVLSASLEIQHARGMDLRHDQALLRQVLGFMLRQQWTPETCFACGANGEAIGGFSEHAASPAIRIDYVQHAMAAMAHGKRALALR